MQKPFLLFPQVYIDITLEIAIHMRSACIILLNVLINKLFLWKENQIMKICIFHLFLFLPLFLYVDLFLCDRNELEDYLELLVRNFNIHTVDNIMCRNLINVNWNGKMYDCDFNQQLEMDITKANKKGNLSR